MFTGIIEELGAVHAVSHGPNSAVLTIAACKILEDLHIGDSIAVNGVCLTVTAFSASGFTADVMHETLNRSALGKLRSGSTVNLERAMSINGRFSGHIVSGHIDGTGVVSHIKRDDNAIWYTIKTTPQILRYIIEKGSVAVDGISLTVAAVSSGSFQISIIPHTAAQTTLAARRIGDTINLETDCIGKYVEKLLHSKTQQSTITMSLLAESGFLEG